MKVDPFDALSDTLPSSQPVAPKVPKYTGPEVKEVKYFCCDEHFNALKIARCVFVHTVHLTGCVCIFSNGVCCMSQGNIKYEKAALVGEKDSTLPPGYRWADLVS